MKNQGRTRTSVTMQAYNQAPPVELRPLAAQPTSCNRLPSSIAQAPYCIQQQNQSHGLRNGQAYSQPVANLSNLQPRQMLQMAFNCFNGQVESLQAAQHGALPQNFNCLSCHQTLSRNTVPQQNYNVASMNNVSSTNVSWFLSNYGNANSTINQVNPKDQSVLLLNEQHNRMHIDQQTAAQPQLAGFSAQAQAPQIICSNQGQTSGGHTNCASYTTVSQYPTTSKRLLIPSQLSNYSHQAGQSHSSYDGNRFQRSSQIQHQPSPYRMDNNAASYCHSEHRSLTSNQISPPSYIGQHFVIQNQNQWINQSAESGVPRDSVKRKTPLQECDTIQVSGHHGKPSRSTVPTFQGNTQSHVLQLNQTTTSLQMSSQVTTSSSTSTSKAPSPILTESTLNFCNVTSKGLLLGGTQLPSQRHGTSPLSCHKASFTKQGQQPSHNSTKGSYSEKPESASYCSAPATPCGKEIQRVSEYQTPVQRKAVSKENVHVNNSHLKARYVQSSEGLLSNLHTDTNPEKENGHKCNNGDGEVQYSEDVAETLELIMALQKVLQQSQKVSAMFPPISQQMPSLEKKDDVTTSSDDSLPLKIDAVGTLVEEGENVEHGSNALNLPKETFKKLQSLFSEPHPETQDCEKHDESAVNCLISDTQSTEVPQSNIGSTTSQSPGCSTVLTSKTPEDHSNDKTDQSNCDIVDLSKLQVHNFTVEKLTDLVKDLENKVKIVPVEDVEKCIVDLYYDGNKSNMEKQFCAFTAETPGLLSKVSIEDMQTTTNFEYVDPTDLKALAHSCHILTNDTILPVEEFRSSWLNVDGQPADIENVLAEPILDLNFTDSALEAGFNTLPLNVYSESEPSTKGIPAATENQNVQMIDNELASVQVSKSKPIYQTFDKLSEKHDDKNVEEPKEQIGHLNSETVGTLAETKKTECEQACRDDEDTEDISYHEITEQSYLSNEDDSSNDSELTAVSVLSGRSLEIVLKHSDKCFRTISNKRPGCNFKKTTSPLCQDKTKVSATIDLGESNDSCNSDNQIKFTCPHVTDVDRDGEHFCPRCWELLPVLHLDLEECPFSPEEGQSCTPDLNCSVLSESNPKTASLNLNSDLSKMTVLEPDLNPTDLVDSCTSLSGKEPHDHLRFTIALQKQVSKITDSMGLTPFEDPSDALNIENPFISVQTKSPRDEVSLPENQLPKNLRLPKRKKKPVEDDHVTTYMVNRKASSKNSHPDYFSVTPSEDDQDHKKERKKRGASRNSPIKQKPPQSGKPDTYMNVYSKTRSDSTNPSTCGESSSALSCTSSGKEVHGQVHSESFKFNMPIEEQMCKPNRLSEFLRPLDLTYNTERRKQVVPSQTKAFRQKTPLQKYPACKKVKLTRTIPFPNADDLFSPDIVVKKASLPKSHPRVPNVTPTNDGRHPFSKDEKARQVEEERSPVMLTIQRLSHSSQSKIVAPKKLKTSFVDNKRELKRQAKACYTKQTGQNKKVKKLKFSLDGSKNGNQNCMVLHEYSSKSKVSTAPVFASVLDQSKTTPSYTDKVSAKEKVYSTWSCMYVPTKKKTSSGRKRQKNVKELFEPRMEALKKNDTGRL